MMGRPWNFVLSGTRAVELKEVYNSVDLKDFIGVLWEIYRDDPNWVPSFLKDSLDARRKHRLAENY